MKKYGLQLRIPPGQQKQKAVKPPVAPPAVAFKDDDDADDVEREISRQAVKNRALEKVEEMHKKALEEDPSVFDYDGHYDEMKEKIARPRVQDKTERKSKYIETLMQKAKERERDYEIIYEKKMLKERNKDDHLFADKEKFVTRAYKEKLAERAKYLEEERLRQIREEKEDVTKKNDLSDFYFSLNKNVAFGAQLEQSTKPSNQEGAADQTQEIKDGARTETTTHSTRTMSKLGDIFVLRVKLGMHPLHLRWLLKIVLLHKKQTGNQTKLRRSLLSKQLKYIRELKMQLLRQENDI